MNKWDETPWNELERWLEWQTEAVKTVRIKDVLEKMSELMAAEHQFVDGGNYEKEAALTAALTRHELSDKKLEGLLDNLELAAITHSEVRIYESREALNKARRYVHDYVSTLSIEKVTDE